MLDSDREDLDGLMISAVLMDVSDTGVFPAYTTSAMLDGAVGTYNVEGLTYETGTPSGKAELTDFRRTDMPRKIVSFAWTDLQNPGCGKYAREYVLQDPGLVSGVEQAYTFYFLPAVYQVAEGHHLELCLMTWDPFRVQLNAWFNLDGSLDTYLEDCVYTVQINNGSMSLVLPTGTGTKAVFKD